MESCLEDFVRNIYSMPHSFYYPKHYPNIHDRIVCIVHDGLALKEQKGQHMFQFRIIIQLPY